ncbi:type IV secretory system conjugative DNA transfer family protein [Streptomyces marincola]|uniref:type IV secretory system conjugative DNA transfer family protein n=1 Tax=Streptomyces marincola TaxID=2878388 RepID=UPI001CF1C4EC|nr:TraM recognition domain-containing protein [Streptomyces marincola]UCM87996.1 TraM recognition domain-containing protein [Streptomyces marincola]
MTDPRPVTEYGYFLGHATRPACGRMPLYSPYDQALRVIGPMGSGKTFRFLARLLRDAPGPALATSTKPDLIELTLGARRHQGPTATLDPQQLTPGQPPLRWSPLHGAQDTLTAELRGRAFIAGTRTTTTGPQDEGAAHYRHLAGTWLSCLIHAAALDGATWRHVLRWSKHPEDPAPRRILHHHPGAGPHWADNLLDATTGDERAIGNTRSTLAGALAAFAHQPVIDSVDIPPEHATDIEQHLTHNGTLYLLGKDSAHSTLSPLVTAITEDVLDRAEQLALTRPHRRLDPPLVIALDEAPNIAPLPSLRQRVADGRGRGLCVIYLVQGWASAEARFGHATAKELAAITNNTLVLGGSHDTALLKDLQELCGTTDTIKTSTTHNHTPRHHRTATSRSHTHERQPVLRTHEIQHLDTTTGQALLLAGNLPPVLVELPALTDHPHWPHIRNEINEIRALADRTRAHTTQTRHATLQHHHRTWQTQHNPTQRDTP